MRIWILDPSHEIMSPDPSHEYFFKSYRLFKRMKKFPFFYFPPFYAEAQWIIQRLYKIFNNRSLLISLQLRFGISPLGSESVDPHIFADPDHKHCFQLSHHYMHCIIQEVNLPGLYNKKIELNFGQLVIERITRMLHCVQDVDASQQTFVFLSPLCRRWSGRRRRILRRTDWLVPWWATWEMETFTPCCCLILRIRRSIRGVRRSLTGWEWKPWLSVVSSKSNSNIVLNNLWLKIFACFYLNQ